MLHSSLLTLLDSSDGMNYASLTDWWDLEIPLIDIREKPDEATVLSSSTTSRVVVHLAFSTLLSGERSCELPPRHVKFGILCEDDVKKEREQEMLGFFFATTSKATQQSRKPWQVPVALVASDDLWKQAKELNIYKEAEKSSQEDSGFQPLPRLWQPDPMLPSILWPVLKQSLPADRDCEIWDLGSGAGRDACFLAEQIKLLGHAIPVVVGIDNHKASAKRCEPFWKNRHVDSHARALNLNLNKIELVENELSMKERIVLCFYAVRFWNRKLVTFLAESDKLESGTIFAMSHFCKPHAGASWDFDHPKVS